MRMVGNHYSLLYFLVFLFNGLFGQLFSSHTTSKPRLRCQSMLSDRMSIVSASDDGTDDGTDDGHPVRKHALPKLLRTSIDQLLSHTSDSIRNNGLDVISVNNLTKTIERFRSGTAEVHGSNGILTDLSTMRLQGEPRFNTSSTVAFHITIDKLRIVYNNYDQQFDGVRQIGKMTIKVKVNALYIEIKSFDKSKGCGDEVLNVYPKRFARVIFEYEDRSAISFSMMGSRDWPWIKPSDVQEIIFPLVNDVVKKTINSALKRYKFCEHRPSSICT